MLILYRKKRIYISLLWLLLCCAPVLARAEPVVIQHAQQKSEVLTQSVLQRIYAMHKKVWSDGTPIKVFTLPDSSPVHRAFVNQYFHMQPYQLKRLWHRLLFSGTGTIPVEVGSLKEMLEKVKNTEGAIGYVDSSVVDRNNESMLVEVRHD